MAGTMAGSNGTVYNGPALDNKAFSQPVAAASVGTVYGGPSAPGTAATAATTAARPISTATGVAPQVLSAGRWFFWIAGLSMINTVITLTGSHTHFIIGMGVTQVLDAVGTMTGSAGAAAAFMVNAFIAAIVVGFGVMVRKGMKWAIILGMVLYGLDGGLLLVLRDFLSAGFHAYVLFAISRSLKYLE